MTQDQATRLFYKHVWPLRTAILRTARYLTYDAAEADDLTQETLVKAYRSIASFDVGTQAGAWLTAILRNTWIDRSRARKREAHDVSLSLHPFDFEDHHPPAGETDHASIAAMLDQLADEEIIGALQELPEEIRWTLLLVDVEQLDHAQVASIMGVPLGTVKSRAFRGHQMLRGKLLGKVKHQETNEAED